MPACLQLPERSTTPEGFDASFATNVLGTTALTQRLLPALIAGAPSRVVFVSSGGMYTQPLGLGDLQHAKLQPWDGSAAYAKEKRCQVALAEHLATAWADKGKKGLGGRDLTTRGVEAIRGHKESWGGGCQAGTARGGSGHSSLCCLDPLTHPLAPF